MGRRVLKLLVVAALASAEGSAFAQAAPPTPAPVATPGAPGAPPLPPSAQDPLPPGQSSDPFPNPISNRDIISVTAREFAFLPDIGTVPARIMTLVGEANSQRLFVSDMHGLLYTVGASGGPAAQYLDLRDSKWAFPVESRGRERGLQSFTLHPQFAQPGTEGFGKFYTYSDSTNQMPVADFVHPNPTSTHDLVLLEWTARTPGAASYDGDAPRELIRWRQPFQNHNGGAIAFNPTARPGSPDFGLLYVAVGDGGSGGDPAKVSQNLASGFGKVLRIDPNGRNSKNGKYGIPSAGPFVSTMGANPEIYAYGVRNSQRFGWDSKNGAMFLSDIGQNIVEEVSPVRAGANLGWNTWEGSYRFVGTRAVSTEALRSDPAVIYPIIEWDQFDPVLLPNNSSASVGVIFNRSNVVPQLKDKLLFGDMPSGELFYVDADNLPNGGQDAIRRVLFVTAPGTAPRKLLHIIQERNRAQGRPEAARADLRFDADASGRVYLLNKADGIVRVIEP